MAAGDTGERTLPTDRANVQRQLELFFRAARFSGLEGRTVASVDVARAEEVTAETATSTLRFSASLGLFTGRRGKFAVTEAGRAVTELWLEDETHARLRLQALFLPHWSAREARATLADGPVAVEDLARQLQRDLPGRSRRGLYLIDWLALAFLVHRDRQGLVWPAPALSAVPVSSEVAIPSCSSGAARRQEGPEEEPHLLMGMTNSELRSLSPDDYCAVLDRLTEVAELTSG
ncbi:hypothetical protein [Streptomyces sp. B29(2018)]|uniref:hypothetical protein n=1 Tax=Streptomyces sp. B29(2018) TaxID=2485016 RepID=UPI000FD6420A|nr:hypothetical protein [Streptomyces sp. B29(2018)]